MKRPGLLLCTLIPAAIITGCTIWNSSNYDCPKGTEYWETLYENENIEAQWCFVKESEMMAWHRIYYYDNGQIEMEWDMEDDLSQGTWKFYDENWVLSMEWNYKDDLEDGEWKYYDEDGEYLCTEIYADGELTDVGDCPLIDEIDIYGEENANDETNEN